MRFLIDSPAGRRVIPHPAEGGTEYASVLRGHPLGSAVKCVVAHVRHEPENRHAVAMLPGEVYFNAAGSVVQPPAA
ncbi:hypothetical protein [Streptomyces axinellae]